MKKFKNILLIAVAMLLVAVISVTATIAYLKSQTEIVTNTFTVGNVEITLDEADVDEYGKVIANAPRVQENDYHLIPGREYVKDPTVRIAEGSEPCYLILVVYIPEELQDVIYYDDHQDSICNQIRNNSWWGQFYDENYSDDPDAYDVFVYVGGDQIAHPFTVVIEHAGHDFALGGHGAGGHDALVVKGHIHLQQRQGHPPCNLCRPMHR